MVTILKDILFAWDDSNDYKTRVESDNTKKMFFFFFLFMMFTIVSLNNTPSLKKKKQPNYTNGSLSFIFYPFTFLFNLVIYLLKSLI